MRAAACIAFVCALSLHLFNPPTLVSASSLDRRDGIPSAAADAENIVPGKYIIELDSPAAGSKHKRSLTPHQDFYDELARRGISVETGIEFNDPNLFVGLEVSVGNSADLDVILSMQRVVAIRQVLMMAIPPLVKYQPVNGVNDPALPPDTQSTHVMTGVDKLHAQGNFGQGIQIGIIDSGIDYLNPSLGGGIGSNFLVKGGYDFVGDAYTGGNTPVPDDDPMDTHRGAQFSVESRACYGHGTHVAGIIAAQPGNIYNITGVAYKSSIYAYRVLGCTGTAQDPVVVEALLRAYRDGNDVITLSLSSGSGWSTSTTGVVASRIAKKGRVVTASLTNDGQMGAWNTPAPASGDDVIAVGSVENSVLPSINVTLSDGHAPIPYFSLRAFPVSGSLPVYATSTDVTITNDACNPLPANTPNLAGYLVVIRRGGCSVATKFANAAAKGAKYFFLYNDGSALGIISSGGYIAVLIRAEDGVYLVNSFASGANVKVTFSPSTAPGFTEIPGGGLISTYSGMGPTYDLRIKPAVVAPGGNILSTIPRAFGGWGVSSGTSMATPFVAGSAALYLSARGKGDKTARSVKKALQNTAMMVPASTADGAPYVSVAQQGAGLINVYNAIHARTVVSTSELLLNDTAYGNNVQIITLSNPTKKSVTYTVSHTPGLTISTINSATKLPYTSPLPTSSQAASVSILSQKFTVWPGFFNGFILSIQPPAGVDPKTFPIYSGFVTISSSLGETFSIPYLGVAAKMKDMAILDRTAQSFGIQLPALLDSAGKVPKPNQTFSLIGNDYPAILYRRAAGTPSFLADLVMPNTQVPGVTPAAKKRGLFWNWLNGIFGNNNGRITVPSGSFFNVPTVGPVQSFPYKPRHIVASDEGNGYDWVRVTSFLNRTAIPNGTYRLLIRSLKVTGNRNVEEDYDAWLSPVFTIGTPSNSTTTTSTSTPLSTSTSASTSSSTSTPVSSTSSSTVSV
ncbi:related to subtilisin-like serine protease [Serendipita indica DSM 11827]|uniref:Related to subtilisin-like serine protease n=1 Tax=Serendipita indica (strain DSM 11827) TaxID=1109443 RepID=G4TJN6_SERID|nr:related to subtilisin-like serine protease [Serendipita indica DSM 11827]